MFKRASCTPSPLLLGASQAKTARLSHVQPLELVQEENAKFTKYQLIASTDLSMLLIKLAKTFPPCVNPLNNLHIPNLNVFIQSRNIDLTSFQCLP